jgi:hypothetical protein
LLSQTEEDRIALKRLCIAYVDGYGDFASVHLTSALVQADLPPYLQRVAEFINVAGPTAPEALEVFSAIQ